MHAYRHWPNSVPFIPPLCHLSASRNINSLFTLSFCCCFRLHIGDRTKSLWFCSCVILFGNFFFSSVLLLHKQLKLFLFWLIGNILWLCCKLCCPFIIDRCLLWLSILATVTGAAKNTKVSISLVSLFCQFRNIARSGTAITYS